MSYENEEEYYLVPNIQNVHKYKDDNSESSEISISKKFEKNYVKYKIKVLSSLTNKPKKIYVKCFGSAGHGSRVRNAATGSYYYCTAGSADSNILFKVTDCSHHNKERKDPLLLYYDSPEQYERHQYTFVSTSIKQKWYDRVKNIKHIKKMKEKERENKEKIQIQMQMQ
jgi:hypothetical protein